MKKRVGFIALFLLITSLVLASCGSDNSSPRATADGFLKAMVSGNADSMGEYSAEDLKQGVDKVAVQIQKFLDDGFQLKYRDLDYYEDGDESEIKFVMDIEKEGEQSSAHGVLKLKKIKDKWYVINME